ncbi:MAG TPA: MFS transporter [Usitatibacter sp.]|nr:MFS transporter [Usitatibacter sp.]
MNRIAHKYVAFMRQPDVARMLAVALVTRMPIGMVGFSMLMFLRDALGDFARAGAAVGINFVALAIAAPVQGRLIDRHGPRRLLYVTGIVCPLALLGVLWSAHAKMPFVVIALFATLAGLFASPITTLTRTAWRHRFANEEDRRTAFALDAVTIELNFTLGPAIIAGMLALAGPRAAFGLAIAVMAAAVAIYLASGVLVHFRKVEGAERHLLGPLTEIRLWLVFVATFGTTIGFGLLEVGYPAYATLLATPALAGVLLAVNSLGSALGGALYGGMHFRVPVERQYAAILALMCVPFFLHALFMQPLVFGVVAFLAGALIAPSITAQSVLVSRFAPAKYATEAFTWSSTFIVSGLGAGMAVGGAIVETRGLPSAFALGGFVVAAMAVLILLALPPRPVNAEVPAAD